VGERRVTDHLGRAYATLGLPFGSSPKRIKRRYRLLVRRWHPDQFATDPVGRMEATDRLVHINRAYRLLERSAHPAARAAPVAPSPEAGEPPYGTEAAESRGDRRPRSRDR